MSWRVPVPGMKFPPSWRPYWQAALLCGLLVLVASALLPLLDLTAIGLLFLLTVAFVAARHGLGPAVFAAVFSGLLFNFFFVWPPLGFALFDPHYLAMFTAMLMIGVLVGQVTAGLRYRADASARRERQAEALSGFAREMSAAGEVGEVTGRAQRSLGELFDGQAVVVLPDAAGTFMGVAAVPLLDIDAIRLAFTADAPVGLGTGRLSASLFHYVPLRAPSGVRGVLALRPGRPEALKKPVWKTELDAFARLLAIALERIHFVEVAQDLRLRAASENLRNSMLAALSHDLRTPLSGLVGLVDALALEDPPLSPAHAAIAADIRESALHMARMVNNLLDLARIQSGEIRLRREWQAIEETIGSALRQLRAQLAGKKVRVNIPAGFPLVEFDAHLIERVIVNLVENAARYSPAGGMLDITVTRGEPDFSLAVADEGPGLGAGFDPFGRFVRGDRNAGAGVGLGLAICRAFVEAHGGSIRADNRTNGGALFTVRLPAGRPPDMDGSGESARVETNT